MKNVIENHALFAKKNSSIFTLPPSPVITKLVSHATSFPTLFAHIMLRNDVPLSITRNKMVQFITSQLTAAIHQVQHHQKCYTRPKQTEKQFIKLHGTHHYLPASRLISHTSSSLDLYTFCYSSANKRVRYRGI